MRYANIDEHEVSNGIENGVSLYIQGCDFHCSGCFNQSTWDFNGGKEWTEETEKEFFKLIDRPYIKRVSILGGSPLAKENLDGVLNLVKQIRLLFPEKSIWLYTGYTWDYIFYDHINAVDVVGNEKRKEILKYCDVLIDGRFEEDKKDLSLRFRGSSNQRIIDVQKSLNKGEIVLWQHTN